ncbi:MAG: RNA polymerase sigma factor [Burkholderiales bacterium]|nr:RNA polymerase sigma factor [Burkholderiales bacterium]
MPAHSALITNSLAQAHANAAREQVFRDLMASHRDRLYRFVLRRIGHSADAEDLAQTAFAEAARAYDRFRGESQLSTWLYGIALNLVRNHLSRSPQRLYQFDDDAYDDLPGALPSPEHQHEVTELVGLLDQGLAELSDEMREVLLLVALDDCSYEDAARQLALPIGTVRSRVSRARAHLRRRFEVAGVRPVFQ